MEAVATHHHTSSSHHDLSYGRSGDAYLLPPGE